MTFKLSTNVEVEIKHLGFAAKIFKKKVKRHTDMDVILSTNAYFER